MHVTTFLTELEMILQEHVRDNFPIHWREDFITESILKAFETKFNHVAVDGFPRKMKINWSAYKLAGTPEHKFGDISLLVNIQYQDGDHVEGVAFLEAKKRSQNKTVFEAMDFKQLRRMYWNAQKCNGSIV